MLRNNWDQLTCWPSLYFEASLGIGCAIECPDSRKHWPLLVAGLQFSTPQLYCRPKMLVTSAKEGFLCCELPSTMNMHLLSVACTEWQHSLRLAWAGCLVWIRVLWCQSSLVWTAALNDDGLCGMFVSSRHRVSLDLQVELAFPEKLDLRSVVLVKATVPVSSVHCMPIPWLFGKANWNRSEVNSMIKGMHFVCALVNSNHSKASLQHMCCSLHFYSSNLPTI